MSDEIRPCPFCGGDSFTAWVRQGSKYTRLVYLECDLCGARTRARVYYSTRDDMVDFDDPGTKACIEAWNRRV